MEVVIAIVLVFGLVWWNTKSERKMQDRLSGRAAKPQTPEQIKTSADAALLKLLEKHRKD